MQRHTLADIKKKNCSLRFGLYKSHKKWLWRRGCGSRPVFRHRRATKVRRSCTNFNKPIYVHQKEAPTRISVSVHLPPLSLFSLYLLYTSPISQTHQYSKPSSGPQGRHRKRSTTSKRYLRQQIHHHSQRRAFLSEPSPTCDRSSRHGRSINHRAPPCSHHHLLHSPKVSRPQRPCMRLQTAADNGQRHLLGQNKIKNSAAAKPQRPVN